MCPALFSGTEANWHVMGSIHAVEPCKTGWLLPNSWWGTVPLVVPRIWGLLGGELAHMEQDYARTS